MPPSAPVSYTHLDVYKRQLLVDMGTCERELRLGKHLGKVGQRTYRSRGNCIQDIGQVALSFHVLSREVAIQDRDFLLADAESLSFAS